MTVTIIRTKSVLPKNWRKTLEPRVRKLSIPELLDAFCAAEQILESRSDVEVQNMAGELVQSIAPMTVVANGPALPVCPRMIYLRYSNSSNSTPPKGLSLLESLAIGTLFALDRACDAMTAAKTKPTWQKACTALASARAFGEWVFMVCMQENGSPYLNKSQNQPEVRAAVKAKIKQAKNLAAKKGWRKKNKPYKQKVFDFYELHKSKFKSTAHAASEVFETQTIGSDEGIAFSTVYNWLRAYVKAKKAEMG
jgi:hypothetical protein